GHQRQRDRDVPVVVMVGQPQLVETELLRVRREIADDADRPIEGDGDAISHDAVVFLSESCVPVCSSVGAASSRTSPDNASRRYQAWARRSSMGAMSWWIAVAAVATTAGVSSVSAASACGHRTTVGATA